MEANRSPVGIYVNFPFCPNKCHFCSFGSRLYDQPVADRYLEAVQKEIIHYGEAEEFLNWPVSTLYFGGGTPTLMCDEIPDLVGAIRKKFTIEPSAEISLEAHPAGLRTELLKKLRGGGFNRISLGVQSFHEPDLNWMNRGHSVREIYDAFDMARQAGFQNINLDLIYGFPGQSLEKWKDSLDSAIKLAPEHISVYGLTVEEKTYLDYLRKAGRFEESSNDLQADMYRLATSVLLDKGYLQYEISNFSRPGFESRHNFHYWTQGEFLGLGAHSASFIGGVHSLNEGSIEGYIRKIQEKGAAVVESEALDLEGRLKEALIFGLRKKAGVRLSSLNPEYLPLLNLYLPRLVSLAEEGFLMEGPDGVYALTERGMLFSDHIAVTLS